MPHFYTTIDIYMMIFSVHLSIIITEIRRPPPQQMTEIKMCSSLYKDVKYNLILNMTCLPLLHLCLASLLKVNHILSVHIYKNCMFVHPSLVIVCLLLLEKCHIIKTCIHMCVCNFCKCKIMIMIKVYI